MDKEKMKNEISSSPAANLDELMHCDDIWEDEKFFCPPSPSAISKKSVMSYASSWCSLSGESRITYASSWCSGSDSEISDVIAPSYQNVDEEIRKACYSFLNPEILEKEADEVQTTEIRPSSRLSIRSEESARPVSTASSSSSSTTAINEAAKMLDETVKTLQSTETLRKLHSTDIASKAKKPVGKPFLKNLLSREQSKEVKNVSKRHVDKAIKDSGVSPKSDLNSSPLGLVEEEENVTLEETGNIVFIQDDKKAAAADWQLVLNSSTTSVIIRRFFQSLSEEQLREVSEGVYNEDVKGQLTDICMDVLRFISESVTKSVLQAIHQLFATPGTLFLKSPLSSEHLTEYFGITEHNIQGSFESSYSQGLRDVIGDTPGRISPTFTEAIAGEVIDQVNSILSVASQASMDGGSFSVTSADSCQVSKDKAAKKALGGAVATMKSCLTGRGTTVKRRIQTQNGFHSHNKEETLAKQCNCKRTKSLWKRCLSVWKKKRIQPATVEHLDEAVRSGSTDLTFRGKESKQDLPCSGKMSIPLEIVDYLGDEGMTPEDNRNIVSSLSSSQTRTSSHHQSNDFGDEDEVEETISQISVDQSQPVSKCLSNNQDDVEETKDRKSKGFSSFFCSILSKKKASAEDQIKQRPLWIQLFSCSSTRSRCLAN